MSEQTTETPTDQPGRRIISLRLPDRLHTALRDYAATQNRTMQDVVEQQVIALLMREADYQPSGFKP